MNIKEYKKYQSCLVNRIGRTPKNAKKYATNDIVFINISDETMDKLKLFMSEDSMAELKLINGSSAVVTETVTITKITTDIIFEDVQYYKLSVDNGKYLWGESMLISEKEYHDTHNTNVEKEIEEAIKLVVENNLSVPSILNTIIDDVIFYPPVTIIRLTDGSTVGVSAQNDEPFDKEKGLAMALIKLLCDGKSSYYNIFKKWCE